MSQANKMTGDEIKTVLANAKAKGRASQEPLSPQTAQELKSAVLSELVFMLEHNKTVGTAYLSLNWELDSLRTKTRHELLDVLGDEIAEYLDNIQVGDFQHYNDGDDGYYDTYSVNITLSLK